MDTLLYIAAISGIGFICWEIQHFLRSWLNLEWQKLNQLGLIREQLQAIEMNMRPGPQGR